MSDNFIKLLADLKDKQVLELVRQRLDEGGDPLEILEESRKAFATLILP